MTSVEYVRAKFECHSDIVLQKLSELKFKPIIKHRPPLSVRTRMLSKQNLAVRAKSKEN
jgi:hypothetical protein